MTRGSIVIIGAGPAGLSSALELTNRGYRPILIEKAAFPGGISRTEVYKQYRFDIGGHRFFSKNERINQLWQEILGDDFLVVPRMSRIFFQNRFLAYPITFINVLRHLGLLESLLIFLSYLKAQIHPLSEEQNFEQWVTNRFGSRLFKMFFKTYTEKVWGIPCREIQSDWATQRIKGLNLTKTLVKALSGQGKTKSLIDRFYYPKQGSGMMWEKFQERITKQGGEVKLNTGLLKLKRLDNQIQAAVVENQNGIKEIPVAHLISSAPLTELVKMIDPPVPPEILKAANFLTFRGFILVLLVLDQNDLFPDQWIYIHTPEVLVGRIQNMKNWSPDLVPEPDKTSLGMEYFCNEGDELWTMSDEKLIQLAIDEIVQLKFSTRKNVIDGYVIRQQKAYPVYDANYRQNLELIKSFLKNINNLHTIGRNGMHRYNNMDHSMLTGILAAENIEGKEIDLWTINEEKTYLEADQPGNQIPQPSKIMMDHTFANLDSFAFGVAIGSLTGLTLSMATLWLIVKGGSSIGANLQLLSQFLIGYSVTLEGLLIGFFQIFVWGFVFGWLFAVLRNRLVAYTIQRIRKKEETLSIHGYFDGTG